MARILPSPDRAERVASPGVELHRNIKDDWSALILPAKEAKNVQAAVAKKSDDKDPANGGIRREPEIPEHEAIAPESAPSTQWRDDAQPEEPDDEEAIHARTLGARIRSVARQASMDPDDGIAL